MSAIDRQPFPRGALIAAAVLVGVSIVGAGVARQINLRAPAAEQTIAPLAARDLTFADGADGSVVIAEDSGARVVHVVAPGEGGFVRGVMRGLARDRRMRGIGDEPGFRLAEWPNGRLALQDLATGKIVELNAFGADNRRAFAEILYAQGAAS
ncbi:MAG: hypothetical protein GC189_02915 [Alphaproteobacteria bacterium]|nr:hypothetical protein [Alphaproteobacteria bacterium]